MTAQTLTAIALVITAITGLVTAIGVIWNISISRRVEHHTNGLVEIIGAAREKKGRDEERAERKDG